MQKPWQTKKQILFVEPAVSIPEVESFNRMSSQSREFISYHLPALKGMGTLSALSDKAIAGIIIGGSAAHVSEKKPWQEPFHAWVIKHMELGTPMLGLCYGHQLLAYVSGAEIGHMEEKQTGQRQVCFEADPRLKTEKKEISPVVSHFEYVKTLPKNFVAFGQSQTFSFDAIRHIDKPIWGFQPHIEATPSFNSLKGEYPQGDIGFSYVAAFLNFCWERKF